MNYLVSEWLNLALRWFHVFAAILWIGQTWFFTWLDRRFHSADEVWMVHSGGFYHVAKKNAPDLTRTLYWFRWEALLTWISGFLLLVLLYYMGGLMVDKTIADITNMRAVLIGLALLPVGWLVYELLWSSPLGRNERIGTVLSLLLIVGLTYALTRVISSRAAYMHVGALLGTLMTANVWMRILPAQRQMIAAARDGGIPDQRLADRAKTRSKHNTFMVMPVVFIMLSSHFPVSTYGHKYNWLILGFLTIAGWIAAKIVREH
jgi:uncharacterized membrane protein